MKTIRCILKPEREKPLEGRHPWIFSGAIDQIDDQFKTGDIVQVFAANGKFLGVGYLNPRSQIAVRMLSFEEESINSAFFERRIQNALALRSRFLPPDTDAYRVIHGEGDFLPGLVADRYGDYLVVQFLTAGIELWKDAIIDLLQKNIPIRGIYEKGDEEEREMEGIPKRAGVLWGQEPPDVVEIREHGHKFLVDIHQGQKTGFFLDQREGRKLVAGLSQGKNVLNCFSYTGGFSIYAAKGGAANVISVDSSEPALNTARDNFRLNGLDPDPFQMVKADVFEYLRSSRQEFDLIILDPPAFCKSKQQVLQSSRGYKDINLFAMKRLVRGGLLYTCSCSSYIDPDLFQKIVFGAAKDARRDMRILSKTAHNFDHPVNIYHPEGEYLKGLLCQAD